LGLELRDASELEVQLPFNIGEPLVYGPERFRGGAVSNRARSRWCGQFVSLHGELLRFT
jgi:hypothetical protein